MQIVETFATRAFRRPAKTTVDGHRNGTQSNPERRALGRVKLAVTGPDPPRFSSE